MEEKTMVERPDLDRKDVFLAVQKALAGHSEMKVMQALLRSLVVVIGVSAPSLQRAEALIDALPGELKEHLRQGWPGYRQHRAKLDKALND